MQSIRNPLETTSQESLIRHKFATPLVGRGWVSASAFVGLEEALL